MLVENFQVKTIITTRHKYNTKQLIINGNVITNNFPDYELEGDFLQIDVCDECMTIGCASGGYVQVLHVSNLVLWKAPLTDGMDKFHTCQYTSSYHMLFGTIFWPTNKYECLLNYFGQELSMYQNLFMENICFRLF
jgi:hypothetical protein